jgi:hypothetical protein
MLGFRDSAPGRPVPPYRHVTVLIRLVAAAALVLTAGCVPSSGHTAGGLADDSRAALGSSSVVMPAQVIEAMNAGGFECLPYTNTPDNQTYRTRYSYLSQACEHFPGRKDGLTGPGDPLLGRLTVDVYRSQGSVDEFVNLYPGFNPEGGITAGHLWSVSGPPNLIPDVQTALANWSP